MYKVSMDDVSIRTAGEVDLPAILKIYNWAILNTTATFDVEPQTLTEKREWLQETIHPYAVLVATRTDEVLGWASLRPFRSKAAYRFTTENSVYVRSDLWGRGLGSALMARLLEVAATNGFRTVIAGIAGDNPASVRLHERLGFEHIGKEREVGYKFERWIDVVRMQKMLGE